MNQQAHVFKNPYESPAPLPEEPGPAIRGARPLGVAILAVLHVLGGLLMVGAGIVLVTHFEENWQGFDGQIPMVARH
jgi:hypothetical protein